jgi:hypothetical protein
MNSERTYLNGIKSIRSLLIEIRNSILDADVDGELPDFEQELEIITENEPRQSNRMRNCIIFMINCLNSVQKNMEDGGALVLRMMTVAFGMVNDLIGYEFIVYSHVLYTMVPSDENLKELIKSLHENMNNELINNYPNDYIMIVSSLSRYIFWDDENQKNMNEIIQSASRMA